MIILVDYDNIEQPAKRLGISYVVNSIISKIEVGEIDVNNRHVTIRLYGGWYENNRFTVRAQTLSSDIAAAFPSTAMLADHRTSVIVRCEMAYSLLSDPGNHLFHTFRSRGMPEGLKANHPGTRGCSNRRCAIIETYNFVTNQVCSQCGTTKPSDIFYRGEQKLVDTMLTSDLIFSSLSSKDLCIVSSDDDFWPGIITTLKSGSKVLHLHTKPGMRTPTFYSRFAGALYSERNL